MNPNLRIISVRLLVSLLILSLPSFSAPLSNTCSVAIGTGLSVVGLTAIVLGAVNSHEHIECREGWVLKGEKCVNPETSDVNNGEPVENAGPLVVFYGALIFMVGCVFLFVKPEKTSGPQTPLLHPVVR